MTLVIVTDDTKLAEYHVFGVSADSKAKMGGVPKGHQAITLGIAHERGRTSLRQRR
jgi:hypothetical protein